MQRSTATQCNYPRITSRIPLALENIYIQQVVIARCGDDVGYGVLEQMHIGPFEPYGLKDWFDGAPG